MTIFKRIQFAAAAMLSCVVLLAVPQFSGCAAGTNQLGSALLPQTFNEKMAVALTAVTTIRQTATALLNAGKLTADDGANVLAVTDAGRAGLDVARSLSATDLTSAEAKLTATHTALVALETYLNTKGGK